jgi:hypothetical protein
MDRLQRELQRLYGSPDDAHQGAGVRALALELSRPADWAALAAVWGGVQADLALPAPAIAVNGVDGLQLWFSFLEPVPPPQAMALLEGLRRQYLAGVVPARVRLRPLQVNAAAPQAEPPPEPTWPVPALQADGVLWSAFVAQDLAPMFTEEPWLDVPPNRDGQALLLAALQSIRPAALELALQRLVPAEAGAAPASAQAAESLDPRRFLLEVMNNPNLDWALRIEAAKALLR